MKGIVKILLVAATMLATGCNTTLANKYMGELYIPTTKVMENLKGDISVSEVMIGREWNGTIMGNYSVSLIAMSQDTVEVEPYYMIELTYEGTDWKFYKEFMMKTDSNVTTYSDPDPYHHVVTHELLYEKLKAPITKELADEIKSSGSLSFQIGAHIIKIEEAGMLATKQFLVEL